MDVFFDISLLAGAQEGRYEKTGLYRVVDNLVGALAEAEDCRLRLCAFSEPGLLDACLELATAHPNLRGVPVTFSRFSFAVHRAIAAINSRVAAGRHSSQWALRLSRKTLHHLAQYLGPSALSIPAALGSRRSIYHAPALYLPEAIRKHRYLVPFLTIYDLIPIVLPSSCSPGTITWCKRILFSLRPEDWVICISRHTQIDLCNQLPWLDPSRIRVIPLAADARFQPGSQPAIAQALRRKYGLLDAPYFLSVAALEPRKNLAHLIRCFFRLLHEQNVPDLKLVLAGGGRWKSEHIADLIAQSPYKERVILTGFLDDDDLPVLYSEAMAFVFPSLYEGFGLPPLEAMQCGVPVISSNTSSLPEVVADAGILVNPTDADAMCQAMLQVYSHSTLRDDLRIRSLRRAREFSWAKCARDTLAAYRQALTS